MYDPDRLNRVHVKTVKAKGSGFVVILSDNSEVPWEYWITLSQAERRAQ